MGWIKRNLFFVIGCVLALGLLGVGGFFIYRGVTRNSEASDKLNEIYGNLKTLAEQKPSSGSGKINNIAIAKEQEKEVREWIAQASKFFSPIPPIPAGSVTSKTYATALGTTVYQLQQEAKNHSVILPPQYYFSFQAQSSKLTISSASLDPLAAQLGEVKAISDILFAARINALDSIQRVQVSEDDKAGSQADYIDGHSLTNDFFILTPYVLTFRCFTPELSRVLTDFAASPNTFIVKSMNVQPASAAATVSASVEPSQMPGRPPGPEGQPPPVAGKGGLPTILKERLLRVVLEVELVKLLPKS